MQQDVLMHVVAKFDYFPSGQLTPLPSFLSSGMLWLLFWCGDATTGHQTQTVMRKNVFQR